MDDELFAMLDTIRACMDVYHTKKRGWDNGFRSGDALNPNDEDNKEFALKALCVARDEAEKIAAKLQSELPPIREFVDKEFV